MWITAARIALPVAARAPVSALAAVLLVRLADPVAESGGRDPL